MNLILKFTIKKFTSFALKKKGHLFNTQNDKNQAFHTIHTLGISMDILKIYLNIYILKDFNPP